MNTIGHIIINIFFALIGIAYLVIHPFVLKACIDEIVIFYCVHGGIILVCSVLYAIFIYMKYFIIMARLYNGNILKIIGILVILLFGLLGVDIWGISLLLGTEYECFRTYNVVLITNVILIFISGAINVTYMTVCYNTIIVLNELLNDDAMYAII